MTTDAKPMKYAYRLICVVNGRPNGVVGFYKYRASALAAKRYERQTTRIRREKVSTELWATLKD